MELLTFIVGLSIGVGLSYLCYLKLEISAYTQLLKEYAILEKYDKESSSIHAAAEQTLENARTLLEEIEELRELYASTSV